jgi:hypothetical protein
VWRQSSTLLLKPHVAKLVVCNPRKNALLKQGNKSDKIDARKLAGARRAASTRRQATAILRASMMATPGAG